MPLEKWIRKLDFEESRKKTAELIGTINENKLKRKMSDNINTINIRKMNELKNNEIKQNELIKKYEKFIEDTIILINNILKEINYIHNLLNLDSNIIELNTLNINDIDISNISKTIIKELKIIKNYIYHDNNNKNKLYEIFIYDNNKIIINNEDKYKLIKDIIFIKEINKDDLEKSIFSINYNKL